MSHSSSSKTQNLWGDDNNRPTTTSEAAAAFGTVVGGNDDLYVPPEPEESINQRRRKKKRYSLIRNDVMDEYLAIKEEQREALERRRSSFSNVDPYAYLDDEMDSDCDDDDDGGGIGGAPYGPHRQSSDRSLGIRASIDGDLDDVRSVDLPPEDRVDLPRMEDDDTNGGNDHRANDLDDDDELGLPGLHPVPTAAAGAQCSFPDPHDEEGNNPVRRVFRQSSERVLRRSSTLSDEFNRSFKRAARSGSVVGEQIYHRTKDALGLPQHHQRQEGESFGDDDGGVDNTGWTGGGRGGRRKRGRGWLVAGMAAVAVVLTAAVVVTVALRNGGRRGGGGLGGTIGVVAHQPQPPPGGTGPNSDGASPIGTIPPPPSNLDVVCRVPSWRTECEGACRAASCCFVVDGDGDGDGDGGDDERNNNCRLAGEQQAGMCELYGPCGVLYGELPHDDKDGDNVKEEEEEKTASTTTTTPTSGTNVVAPGPPPPGLADLCSRQNVESDPRTAEQCERQCSRGLCCIGLGLGSEEAEEGDSVVVDCAQTGGNDCDAYRRHCSTVWPAEAYGGGGDADAGGATGGTTAGGSSPKGALEVLCGAGEGANNNALLCDELCRLGSCCWEVGPGNCIDFNRGTCPEYAACPGYLEATIRMKGTHKEEEDGVPRPKVVPPPPPVVPIADICAPDKVLTHHDGLDACKAACALGSCCFAAEEGDEDCSSDDNNSNVCSEYETCRELPYDTWRRHQVPSPLEHLCSPDRLRTAEGREACSYACQFGECCMAGGTDSCYLSDPGGECSSYAPCRANLRVVPPPSTLVDVCNLALGASDVGKVQCMHLCQPAACCWEGKDANGVGLCEGANSEVCSEYEAPCMAVRPNLDYGMVPASATSPVARACSSQSLRTDDGIRSCRKECERAWCCVADDASGLSCYESDPYFCMEYAPVCGPLLSSDVLYSDVKDEALAKDNPVQVLCSMQNILTADGRAKCENACAFAACCHAEGTYSCRRNNLEYCDDMDACTVLKRLDKAKADNAGVAVPFAPTNLPELCSGGALSTFSGRIECEEACAPSECCVEVEDRDNCRDSNAAACDSYGECASLIGG